ncbi:alanine--tRNA ligase [Deinococcus peraridilitoris]|uniref:Alanine--tRNA ligase n=1 Tax=Deinococcus peraridilitoris (strain DSM 19664 / LMG 22246 / CIP 109416 / KR-200) TaxID=937777 RepID=K9ZY85_DEIPD|nr:alanine--tRNA ligase [Deinococcus peraridilitoris]AFZ66603.1 alanine--tRNA ligase [Deinococcus peraridilitoris DSM 19664]
MTRPTPSTAEIREKFLQFFESKGHLRLPSHSTLSPDPSTLFTVAGMQPFKPQFLGAAARFPGYEGEHKRVTTAQKSLRVTDIENVGRTRRHLSLFEMLGNFSFGDYFKREAITWAWELLTAPQYFALDKTKLHVTIYKDDQEAFELWTQEVGLPEERILRFDADENFWPADAPLKGPNGPCGPCSEIYYDRGPDFGSDSWEDYAQTRESARFLEIWNLVFPQYDRQEPRPDGTPVLADLPFKNIDTGMGLERIASILQDVPDFYGTDTFRPIIERVAELSGQAYQGETSVSHRVIAEHLRSVSMCLADGVTLSNTGRGYVVRKVLRRASRHAYLLGFREPVLHSLVALVVAAMGEAYPELKQNEAQVQGAIKAEEARFLATLESGTQRLDAMLGKLEKGQTLNGAEAFMMSDTYGFPLDLTREIAEEYGVSVDEAGFDKALEEQQERARAASRYGKSELFGEVQDVLENVVREHGATEFVGYEELVTEGEVLAVVQGGESLSKLPGGSEAQVVLSRTPFYAEGGGEVGDQGWLEWQGEGNSAGRAFVRDTRKTPQGLHLHDVIVEEGELHVGARVRGVVAPDRQATERHHTATHLLHAALRAVLGSGVRQAGSLVAPDRLRFDFSHGAALTAEELREVERLVNRWIQADFPVTYASMAIDQARAAGAMALFGEKYGDVVRVVSVEGGVPFADTLVTSKELCGGAHVTRTGEIGSFVLVSDENVAAGVRRIEALAGEAASDYVREQLRTLSSLAAGLNTSPQQLPERLNGLQGQLKELQSQVTTLKRQLAQAQMEGGSAQEVRELGGFKVSSLRLSGVEGNELRVAADSLLDQSKADLVVVASDKGLVVKATKSAVERGAHAGQLIGKLAQAGGGKGGGRPDMAQAGIQDAQAALRALDSAF